MTEHAPTPPDGWFEVSGTVPGAGQTYAYHVCDDERVLVGVEPLSDSTDEIRLEVSSVERAATVRRHGFAVATYDRKENGVEGMISFMELVSDTLPSESAGDERLFVAVRRCIEEFDTTTDPWRSFFTSETRRRQMNQKVARHNSDGEPHD